MFINIAYASESMDQFMNNVDKLIINPLILLLFALAVVYFIYGLLEFLLNSENDEKKTTGKTHMLWGVIGMTIMMGVFMLMNIILNTFNIQGINVEQRTVTLPPAN
jgi:uncharacterized membrane protein YidH (DUF202 family)